MILIAGIKDLQLIRSKLPTSTIFLIKPLTSLSYICQFNQTCSDVVFYDVKSQNLLRESYFLDGFLGDRWTGSIRDPECMPPSSANLNVNPNNRSSASNSMPSTASTRTSSSYVLYSSTNAATAAGSY